VDEGTSSVKYARHVVNGHTQGIICAAEVWHQFVDHATEETFPAFMAELTPFLQKYFRNHILAYYPADCERERERTVLKWLADYYRSTGESSPAGFEPAPPA
jgi:hypothetical protein